MPADSAVILAAIEGDEFLAAAWYHSCPEEIRGSRCSLVDRQIDRQHVHFGARRQAPRLRCRRGRGENMSTRGRAGRRHLFDHFLSDAWILSIGDAGAFSTLRAYSSSKRVDVDDVT